MRKCDFNKVPFTLPRGGSTVNLVHIFRTLFYKNTFEELLLSFPLKVAISQISTLDQIQMGNFFNIK